MGALSDLSLTSQVSLYALLALTLLFSFLLFVAQVGSLRGKPFQNPDGTSDDWNEQKILYGMAWADIVLACPLSLLALVLVFARPRPGFVLLGMVAFYFLWANTMTTVTSLRFEKPRISLQWLIVFPAGAVVGLALLVWMFAHFSFVFGP